MTDEPTECDACGERVMPIDGDCPLCGEPVSKVAWAYHSDAARVPDTMDYARPASDLTVSYGDALPVHLAIQQYLDRLHHHYHR